MQLRVALAVAVSLSWMVPLSAAQRVILADWVRRYVHIRESPSATPASQRQRTLNPSLDTARRLQSAVPGNNIWTRHPHLRRQPSERKR